MPNPLRADILEKYSNPRINVESKALIIANIDLINSFEVRYKIVEKLMKGATEECRIFVDKLNALSVEREFLTGNCGMSNEDMLNLAKEKTTATGVKEFIDALKTSFAEATTAPEFSATIPSTEKDSALGAV